MRYYLVILLGLITFLSPAQDSTTVCIKPSTARYFLEADDERWVLREKDSLSTELITNLKDQVIIKDKKIETYQLDSTSYETRYVTLLEYSTLKDKRIKKLEGKIRLRKTLEILAAIGIVLISIL